MFWRFSLQIPLNWQAYPGDYENGNTTIILKPSAKNGVKGKVSSSIVLIAHLPKNGETFDIFKNAIISDSRFIYQETPLQLGFGNVKAYEGLSASVYQDEMGAHNIMVLFSRSEPQRPGLALEYPGGIKKENPGSAVAYFRNSTEYSRAPGEIYYLVLLDTTVSVFEESKKEFNQVLSGLIVE